MAGPGDLASSFDVSVPNVATIYDYMLGGKDNFAADRDWRPDPHVRPVGRPNSLFGGVGRKPAQVP